MFTGPGVKDSMVSAQGGDLKAGNGNEQRLLPLGFHISLSTKLGRKSPREKRESQTYCTKEPEKRLCSQLNTRNLTPGGWANEGPVFEVNFRSIFLCQQLQ